MNEEIQKESLLTKVREALKNNKKKVFIILIIIILLELLWVISFIVLSKNTNSIIPVKLKAKEEIASFSFALDSKAIIRGTPFKTEIILNTKDRQVNGVDALILYDPQMLTVVDSIETVPAIQVANGDLFPSLLVNHVDQETGRITLTASRLNKQTSPVTGLGTLAIITFTAQQVGNTTLSFLFDDAQTNTSNVIEAETSKNILTHVQDVQIEIKN